MKRSRIAVIVEESDEQAARLYIEQALREDGIPFDLTVEPAEDPHPPKPLGNQVPQSNEPVQDQPK